MRRVLVRTGNAKARVVSVVKAGRLPYREQHLEVTLGAGMMIEITPQIALGAGLVTNVAAAADSDGRVVIAVGLADDRLLILR